MLHHTGVIAMSCLLVGAACAKSGESGGTGGAGTGGQLASGGTQGSGETIGSGGTVGSGGTTGSGGSISSGGTSSAGGAMVSGGASAAGGAMSEGGATGTGGDTSGDGGTVGNGGDTGALGGSTGTGGSTAAGGSTGSAPACSWTSTPSSCTYDTDEPCTKACGPGSLKGGQLMTCQSEGKWKSADCVFAPGDYAKYQVSDTTPDCPGGTTSSSSATSCFDVGGTGTATCTQACTTVDEVCAGYTDGSNKFYGPGSSSGVGFCICSGTKWSCANKTAWPCSPSGGPSSTLDVDVTGC